MHQRVLTQLEQACTQLATWKGRSFQTPVRREMQCYSDASDWAWVATSPGSGEAFGFFTNSDLDLHINAKEFQAAIFARRSYMMGDPVIKFYTDWTTLFHYIRKWGGHPRGLVVWVVVVMVVGYASWSAGDPMLHAANPTTTTHTTIPQGRHSRQLHPPHSPHSTPHCQDHHTDTPRDDTPVGFSPRPALHTAHPTATATHTPPHLRGDTPAGFTMAPCSTRNTPPQPPPTLPHPGGDTPVGFTRTACSTLVAHGNYCRS